MIAGSMTAKRRRSPLQGIAEIRVTWHALEPLLDLRRSTFVLLGALSAVGGFAEAMLALCVAQAGMRIAGSGIKSLRLPFGTITGLTVPRMLIIAAVLGVVSFIMQAVVERLIAKTEASAARELRSGTYAEFLRSDWTTQSHEVQGEFNTYVGTHTARTTSAIFNLQITISASLTTAMFVIGALLIAPVAAIGVLVIGLAVFMMFQPIQTRTKRLGTESAKANKEFGLTVYESIAASRDVKVFNVEGPFLKRFAESIAAVEHPAYMSRLLGRVVPRLFQRVVILLIILGLAVVYLMHITNATPIVAVLLLFLRALQQAQTLQSSQQQLAELVPFIVELGEHRAMYRSREERHGSTPLAAIEELRITAGSYAYPGGESALVGVDFYAHRRELVGLIGPSGSGKTTLAEILCRLRPLSSGSFLVNGQDAEVYAKDEWSKQVALVPQFGRVLDATVMENIRFLRPWISDDDVREAARRAFLLDEILAMDDGFDTEVAERGKRGLSGGQTQRLAIARAIAGRPSLLIFDEPTSALDGAAEHAIVKVIDELRTECCVIVIAHRLSTLRTCDRVLVLRTGEVEAFCAIDRLVEESEYYRDALARQSLG
jgi:ATP-binding cassette subfamily B protein